VTPLILVILAAMWAAVLLPPYLRDRNETGAGGSRNSVRNRIGALTSSFSGGRSYLPVGASGQSTGRAPLPHGAKHPVGGPRAVDGPETMPQSSAVQILDASGQRPADHVAQLRPVGSTAAVNSAAPVAEPVLEPSEDARTKKRSASAFARQRRRDVLHTLMGLAGITLVATVALGGPMLYVQLLADAALITYVYLLVRRRKVTAEQEMKVAFLPHGGNGASATALLEQGGGWNPGTTPVDNLRVLRAEAN
jgi:hypothetical protein